MSVAIAAFNAVPFVARAIDSALAQAGPSLEVVVVDDGSGDDTAGFVEARYGHDPRVRVIALPRNAGPSAARNAAFAAARGTWIAVLDADDAFADGHLERLSAAGGAAGADLVAGNFRLFDAATASAGEPALAVRAGVEPVDRYAFVTGARPYARDADFGLLKPLFRAAFLRANGLTYPEGVRYGEDFELVLRALLAGGRYVLTRDACTYLYTTRASGHSRTPVDYAGLIRRTEALRRDLAGDARLRALVRVRANALRRLEINRNWGLGGWTRARTFGRAMASAEGRRWIAERTIDRLFGRAGAGMARGRARRPAG